MPPRRSLPPLLLLVLLLGALIPAAPAFATVTYVVNTTADDVDGGGCEPAPGDCTLREAILAANASPGLDRINFALGSGVPTINVPVTPLPQITDRLFIHGSTGGATRVELTGPPGQDALTGLHVSGQLANGSLIRKMVINGFGFSEGGFGILIENSDGNGVTGNWLGTDETGMAPGEGAAAAGIGIINGSNNQIGGTTEGTRNVVSGNFSGILISATAADGLNNVVGNYVGTTRHGTGTFGGNVGINVLGPSNEFIQHNVIGGHLIGLRFAEGTTGASVNGNRIGIDVKGNPIPNGTGVAVLDSNTTGIRLSENRINHNLGLGIDLGDDGVTPNDAGVDADAGPNDLQNFPVVTRADSLTASTFIRGRLRSTPNTPFLIELFSSPSCDASGYGEGEQWIGTVEVLTDEVGRATFAEEFTDHVPVGHVVTSTARAFQTGGSSSEFSACQVVI